MSDLGDILAELQSIGATLDRVALRLKRRKKPILLRRERHGGCNRINLDATSAMVEYAQAQAKGIADLIDKLR